MSETLPQTPPPVSIGPSSPIKKVEAPLALHVRDELQMFADMGTTVEYTNAKDFLKILGEVPSNVVFPSRPYRAYSGDFVDYANAMSKVIQDSLTRDDLIQFKHTGTATPVCHVVNTQCKPDLIAARVWIGDTSVTHWSLIQLVGEVASKGKSAAAQLRQAQSYLYYLMLARPDLHVGQGILVSNSEQAITLLLAVAGTGICMLNLSWDDVDLEKVFRAFIYRLYDPRDFRNSAFVGHHFNPNDKTLTYTLRIKAEDGNVQPNESPDFRLEYSSSPFGTRTHVLCNQNSKIKVCGKPLPVLKFQLCRNDLRFDEYSILSHIHTPKPVPGVVAAMYRETIKLPTIEGCENLREVHVLGLDRMGRPFSTIPTVGQMMRHCYDLLEVLRYLRQHRQVLHRDISKGNLLYFTEVSTPPTPAEMPAVEMNGPITFIKRLLGESADPENTASLLIDFGHGEILSKNQDGKDRADRTGTPMFIARAVQMGGPVPIADFGQGVAPIPPSPAVYSMCHPDRVKQFPSTEASRPHREMIYPESGAAVSKRWRHELHHDAESVFWLILYWIARARPNATNETDEPIELDFFQQFRGNAKKRTSLIASIVNGDSQFCHSFYAPVVPLVQAMARVIRTDIYWMDGSDPRSDPEYFNEAMQRLLVDFLLENKDKEFMNWQIHPSPRIPDSTSQIPDLSITGYRVGTDCGSKRAAPIPEEGYDSKRQRLASEEAESS